MFGLNNVKNKAILRDFLQKWKVECSAGSLVPMRFAIFHSTCVKYCACHEKLMPGHTKCCTCHVKSSQQTWRSDAPNCNPCQEMSALTSEHLWWTCLLYCACYAKCIFEDPLQMPHACHVSGNALLTRCTILCACHAKRHLNLQKWREHVVFCTFSLWNVLRATTACTFSTSQLPKVVRQWCVLYILTLKCASCHNGVHFFDIATSKSGPSMVCFVHVDFEMCFAPQRRALFWHRNFQKWSDAEVFCTFWLRNVLRATTASTFSSLIWPAGSAPAALASWLFDPPEPQIIRKTQCFATFLPFRASASSFFWLFLFSDLLSSNLSLLFICPYCRKFDFKLPSIKVLDLLIGFPNNK